MKVRFRVNEALCSDCKACIIACMDQNDVDVSRGEQPNISVCQKAAKTEKTYVCNGCLERILAGRKPACAHTCALGAITYVLEEEKVEMKKTEINTKKAPAAVGPYSQAIRVGNLVMTSGQIPLDPQTGILVEGGITEQTHQVFKNLEAVLKEAGLTFDNVIKTTVFLADIQDFAAMNEVYAQFFAQPYPSRSAVQVAALPKGALVEIECICTTSALGVEE